MSNLAAMKQVTPPVTDMTRLQERVSGFCDPVRVLATGYRRLSGDSPETLLTGLLREIDETILPREIKLVTDTDRTAFLFVSNRRLMRVDVKDHPHTPPPGGAVAMIRQLQEALGGATRAVLRSARKTVDCPQGDAGCTVSALLGAASLDVSALSQQDPVAGLFAILSGRMTAWLTLDPAGFELEQGGDPAWRPRLNRLVDEGLADIDAQLVQSLATPEQPGCIMMNSGAGGKAMLIYARAHDGGFLAILPDSELPELLPTWRGLFG